MIVHIVMFKFFDENKKQNLIKIKQMLEDLPNEVPSLQLMEVGINFSHSDRAYDLSLYSTFDTKEDLKLYANHSSHVEVLHCIKEYVKKTKIVDYVI